MNSNSDRSGAGLSAASVPSAMPITTPHPTSGPAAVPSPAPIASKRVAAFPILDSAWRAALGCLHPTVIAWSILPLVVAGGALAMLGWLGWESAVDGVRALLERFDLLAAALKWLDSMGANRLRAMLAPIIVVALAVPLVVLVSLLLVSALMTPAVVDLVARQRYPALQRARGARWWQGLGWSLLCTLGAVLALLASLPLWLVPPLALVLPPLIWGWLTYRVFAFDVLADHASAPERRQLMHERRWPLLGMGVVCGYLGAAPALLWATGALTLILAPVMALLSVWLYTLVFAFAALWFAHYSLGALEGLRIDAAVRALRRAAPLIVPPTTPERPA
jgi:Etoposide-induced protein 2.4 (EI24)